MIFFSTKIQLKKIIAMALSVFVAVLSTAYLQISATDKYLNDIYHSIIGKAYISDSTVIVSVDSETFSEFRNIPFSFWGPQFAHVVDVLLREGASTIALDFQFLITPEQWFSSINESHEMPLFLRNYDLKFDQALAQGRTVLGAKLIQNNGILSVVDPPQEYLEALPAHRNDVGLTTFKADLSSVVRSFIPAIQPKLFDAVNAETYSVPDPWWTLAPLMVKKSSYQVFDSFLKRTTDIFNDEAIVFCGPPGTVPKIQFTAFFRESGLTILERQLIKGRMVFVGLTDCFFDDSQKTPYSQRFLWFGGYPNMDSVEIHANIAETMLHPGRLTFVPLWVTVLFIWIPIMTLCVFIGDKKEFLKKLGLLDLFLVAFVWVLGLFLFWKGYVFQKSGIFIAMSFYFIIIYLMDIVRKIDLGVLVWPK